MKGSGFQLDTGVYMQMLYLLDKEGITYISQIKDLKYLLAPIVAHTAEEQKHFYSIFDDFIASHEVLPILPEPPNSRGINLNLLTLISVILIILAALVWSFANIFSPTIAAQAVKIKQPDFRIVPSESLVLLQPSPEMILSTQDSNALQWEVYSQYSDGLNLDSIVPGAQFKWQAGQMGEHSVLILKGKDSLRFLPKGDTAHFQIICPQPPKTDSLVIVPSLDSVLIRGREHKFSIEGLQPTDTVEWLFPNGTNQKGRQTSFAFSEKDVQASILLRLSRGDDCYSERQILYQLNTSKPFVPLLAYQPDPSSFHNYNFLYQLILLITVLWAFVLLLEWVRSDQSSLSIEGSSEEWGKFILEDQEPYDIPYLDKTKSVKISPDLFRIAEIMRRREKGMRNTFDDQATIEATIRQGGFPSWRERNLRQPVSYLFLLSHHSEQHQMDHLLKHLMGFLKSQDAPIKVYWHDGQFDQFWENSKESIGLERLYQLFRDHRLIILGDGHGLIQAGLPPSLRLVQRRLRILQSWTRRLLLTTEVAADWSWQERLLHKHFLLYPLSIQGIHDGIRELDSKEEYQVGSFELWQKKLGRSFPEKSCRYAEFESVEGLQEWLSDDPDLFRWLCGLAVSHHPHWYLTIAIGQSLGLSITHDRLIRLARIPWLANNQFNNRLRLDLLRHLSSEDAKQVRQRVLSELKSVADRVKGSFAEIEWTSSHVVQSFALNSRENLVKQSVLKLLNYGWIPLEQEAELEFIVREQADGQGLSKQAKDSLKNWLKEDEARPRLTLDLLMGSFYMFLGILGLWHGWQVEQTPLVGRPHLEFHRQASITDPAVILHNEAIQIARVSDTISSFQEWSSRWELIATAIEKLHRAKSIRGGTYSLADSTLFAIIYNDRARMLNFSLLDSVQIVKDLSGPHFATMRDTLFKLPDYPTLACQLWSHHLDGLHAYYKAINQQEYFLPPEQNLDSARAYYQRIVSLSQGNFFDTIFIRMPVNLQTLLDIKPEDLQLRIRTGSFISANTDGQPITATIVGSESTMTMRLDSFSTLGNAQFEFGRVDQWAIKPLQPLGQLQSITLKLGGGDLGVDDWFIHEMVMSDTATNNQIRIPLQSWIGDYSGDGARLRIELDENNQDQQRSSLAGRIFKGNEGTPLGNGEAADWEIFLIGDNGQPLESLHKAKTEPAVFGYTFPFSRTPSLQDSILLRVTLNSAVFEKRIAMRDLPLLDIQLIYANGSIREGVLVDNQGPQISLLEPVVGDSDSIQFRERFQVIRGTVRDESGPVTLIINQQPMMTVSSQDIFAVSLNLPDSIARITIEATDAVGNLSVKTFFMEYLNPIPEENDRIGPQITLLEPSPTSSNSFQFSTRGQIIKGRVNGARPVTLKINQQPITVSSEGIFTAFLNLPDGITSIRIEAKDQLENISELKLTMEFISSPGQQSNQPLEITNTDSTNEKGKNYILLIGIDNYSNWSSIPNAVKDCRDLASMLTSFYQFEEENVITLFNQEATRENILETFESLQDMTSEYDNLLIYYTGHGFYDENSEKGYWVPVTARLNKIPDLIRNTTIHDYMRTINTKHTLLIVDTDYAGSLFSSIRGPINENAKSRWAFTSGDIEKVNHGEPGQNSPFARYLIRYLRNNTQSSLRTNDLIEQVKITVERNTVQTPQGSSLRQAGDEGGVFIFKRK